MITFSKMERCYNDKTRSEMRIFGPRDGLLSTSIGLIMKRMDDKGSALYYVVTLREEKQVFQVNGRPAISVCYEAKRWVKAQEESRAQATTAEQPPTVTTRTTAKRFSSSNPVDADIFAISKSGNTCDLQCWVCDYEQTSSYPILEIISCDRCNTKFNKITDATAPKDRVLLPTVEAAPAPADGLKFGCQIQCRVCGVSRFRIYPLVGDDWCVSCHTKFENITDATAPAPADDIDEDTETDSEADTESSEPDLNTCTPDEFTAALCGQLDKLMSKPKTGKAAHGQKSKPVSVRLPVSLIEAMDSHIAIGGWSSRGHFIRALLLNKFPYSGSVDGGE